MNPNTSEENKQEEMPEVPMPEQSGEMPPAEGYPREQEYAEEQPEVAPEEGEEILPESEPSEQGEAEILEREAEAQEQPIETLPPERRSQALVEIARRRGFKEAEKIAYEKFGARGLDDFHDYVAAQGLEDELIK